MSLRLRPLFVLALTAAYGAAHAWSATGHMVIAAIAKRDLTPYALNEANRLLKIGATDRADDFITAGPWADDIRSARPETGNWHFINLHFRSDRKRVENQPEKENAVAVVERFAKVLGDRTKPDAERADALRYLIHFVGDLHQPLHSVARDTDEHPKGDRGGNDFKIQTPASMVGTQRPPNNLHSLWDGGLGLFPFRERPLTVLDRAAVELQAETIASALPRQSLRRVEDLRPMTWAQEGLEEAKKTVYDLMENTVPSEDYMRRGRTLSARRAAYAGYRLADIVNAALR
ncbi:MAG: S1/P1 nuclease [Fimbriimonas sp.]